MSTFEATYVSVLAGLLGALLGAFVAWLLQLQEKKHRARKEQINQLRFAQVVIAAQHNAMCGLWNQFLAAHEQDPNRHREITTVGDYVEHLFINVSALGFLVEMDEPTLILDLNMANADFQLAVGCLAFRNNCLDEAMKISVISASSGGDLDTSLFVPAENDHLIKIVTNNLYQSVITAMATCEKANQCICDAMKRRYKNAKPIESTFPKLGSDNKFAKVGADNN
ncbi:hypothetical protein OT109_11680 [Phycisphaeraceae bacterium D3-23]